MRPATVGLTDHELKIMQILWRAEPLTVAEIQERFPQKPQPAYNSLLTALRGLERKKFLEHQQDGKAYRYIPRISRHQYALQSVKRLVKNLYEGRAADLAINLIQHEELGRDEIEQLKNVLETLK